MTLSKAFTLGGDYFRTDIGDEVSTVIRLPVTPASQSVIDNATSSGNLNGDGSINYVNVFGNDQFEQLSAPNSWMSSLANDPSYQNTINNSISLTGSVATTAFDLAGEGTVLSSTNILNTDANNNSTIPSGGGSILRYPLNSIDGYDYLLIGTYRRNPSPNLLSGSGFDLGDVDDVAVTKVDAPDIALPMQPGISDSNSVDWGSDSLNPLQLAGARLGGKLMENLSSLDFGAAASSLMETLKSGAAGIANDVTTEDIKAYFAGQAVGANIFTRATGKVINPNLELLFRGPQLRTFSYNYKFTPRDPDEARVVRSIIKHFKKNMAVQRSSSGLFLETPNIFQLTYIYSGQGQHPFLNKIKKCALTNLNVEYTPDGSYMTYKDGSMTSYNVSMQFSELTPIYSSNYDNSDDMGY